MILVCIVCELAHFLLHELKQKLQDTADENDNHGLKIKIEAKR